MASKLQIVTEFSQKKTLELASVRGNWQRYLKTAARIYKYPFRDQLLINVQRPDATACATIEFWNSRMDRWVNRGSRGIALLDDSSHKTRLKYVFDVSDTHPGRHRPQEPQLWQMEPAYEETVLESISNSFEVEREPGVSFVEQICSMSQAIAEDNLTDYLEELRNTREDSFLEDLDDLNLSVRLKTLLANSLAYTVLTRCGYDADRYGKRHKGLCHPRPARKPYQDGGNVHRAELQHDRRHDEQRPVYGGTGNKGKSRGIDFPFRCGRGSQGGGPKAQADPQGDAETKETVHPGAACHRQGGTEKEAPGAGKIKRNGGMRNVFHRGRRKPDLSVPQRRPPQDGGKSPGSFAGHGQGNGSAGLPDRR